MSIPTPDNSETWRGLAHELTPEQTAWLEQFERDEKDHPDLTCMTVAIARDYARRNDGPRTVRMRDIMDELVRRHGEYGACRTPFESKSEVSQPQLSRGAARFGV